MRKIHHSLNRALLHKDYYEVAKCLGKLPRTRLTIERALDKPKYLKQMEYSAKSEVYGWSTHSSIEKDYGLPEHLHKERFQGVSMFWCPFRFGKKRVTTHFASYGSKWTVLCGNKKARSYAAQPTTVTCGPCRHRLKQLGYNLGKWFTSEQIQAIDATMLGRKDD